MNKNRQAQTKRIAEETANYIAAEKSDPFLAARVRTHMANGVAGTFKRENGAPVDAYYSAKTKVEERQLPDTDETYFVTVYTGRSRP